MAILFIVAIPRLTVTSQTVYSVAGLLIAVINIIMICKTYQINARPTRASRILATRYANVNLVFSNIVKIISMIIEYNYMSDNFCKRLHLIDHRNGHS